MGSFLVNGLSLVIEMLSPPDIFHVSKRHISHSIQFRAARLSLTNLSSN